MNIAVFPGSFDPFTIGHQNIVERVLPLFDKVIVAVGINSNKKSFFPLEKRMEIIGNCFDDEKRVEVMTYEGLTVDFCRKTGARFIVRGIRNVNDFLFEQEIAAVNARLAPEIETVFLATAPELSFVSSTVVRELYLNGGDYQQFIP